jgi:hypothetical protein
MKLSTAVLAVFAVLLFVPAAHADGIPTGGTLYLSVNATFGFDTASVPDGEFEQFQASYELQNIGSPVSCIPMVFFEPCSGGNFVLVGPMNFSTSGPLGTFTLEDSSPAGNFFNFLNAAAPPQLIQIEFDEDFWEMTGTFPAQKGVLLDCFAFCIGNSEIQGVGTFTITQNVPEPNLLAMLLPGIGLLGLALRRIVPRNTPSPITPRS